MNKLSSNLLMLSLLCSPAAAAKNAQMVESTPVEWQVFQQQHTINCQLIHAQQRKVYSQQAGKISRLNHQVGDQIKQNALLLAFDDTSLKLEQKKAKLVQQQTTLELQRHQTLHQQNAIAASELNRAQNNLKHALIETQQLQTRLSQQRFYAPFDAVVTQRLVEVGDSVNAHSHLLTLAAPNSLHVSALVEEALFLQLKPQQTVNIQLPNLTQQSGRISRLQPTLNSNHQGSIEVRFDRLPKGLLAGQRCQLQININHAAILSIPLQALRHDRQGAYLWIINAQQKTERQSVSTGRYFSDRIEIRSGLTAGERVVLKGFSGLKNQQKVIDLSENSSQEKVTR